MSVAASRVAPAPARDGAARRGTVMLAGVLLLGAVVTQVAVLPWLPLPGGGPNLVLVAVVALALALGMRAGAGSGFGAGLALDLVPPAAHPVGQWAFVLCLTGYLAGLLSREARETTAVALVAAGFSALLAPLAFTLCGVLLGDPRASWSATAATLPDEVLYAVALIPPAVAVLHNRAARRPGRDT
jgi:rod shape-determining protein MreD